MDVSRSCTQAQWHSFCQTWLCFGRRKNAELCWYISGKAADMARLADYFIVVGYDQEKAGKFGGGAARRLKCKAVVCVQAVQSVCVMMLMLDSFVLSFTLATQATRRVWEHFLFFFSSSFPPSLTDQISDYHHPDMCLQIRSDDNHTHTHTLGHGGSRYLSWINRNFFSRDSKKICHILCLLTVLLSAPEAGFTAS